MIIKIIKLERFNDFREMCEKYIVGKTIDIPYMNLVGKKPLNLPVPRKLLPKEFIEQCDKWNQMNRFALDQKEKDFTFDTKEYDIVSEKSDFIELIEKTIITKITK